MTSFALEPIYGSLLLAILAVLTTVAVIVLVTPPAADRSQRRLLIALRLLAAAVLWLALFRPALLRTDNRPVDAALVVAVDTSRSMTLPDGDGGQRWTTQVQAWKQLAGGLQGLDQSLAVRLLAYDATARPIASVAPDALGELSPIGELTDLSAAALATIQAAEGQPIAGVVLIGDGTQTAPLTGAGARRIVETLNSLGVPLWTVPIGPAGGDSASRDVAVDSLPESYQLFAGNDVEIQFQLLSRGMSGKDIPVRLSWINAEGQTTEIAVRSVTATKANDVAAVAIAVTAPAPGTYRLKVEADIQEGELVTTNNQQIAFIEVREGGGRILYLEGSLRLEQAFLRRSLRRFPDLDLSFRWIPSDTTEAWPADLQDWFEPGKFDIYVLGDLDANALGDEQLSQLASAVDAGAGLVTLGGYQTYGNGGYASSPIANVIPIEMDRSRRRDADAKPTSENQIDGPLTIELVRNHPITDLGGNDPAKTWQRLPPLLGANRLRGPKVSPGVQVLLQSSDGDPLLVVGQYGKGRTAALAIDSTWRWWRAGESEAHRRFWRQLVLWLLSREEISGDRISIQLDARRFSTSEPPEFRASVESIQDASETIELVAEVVDDSGQVQAIDTSTESHGEASESNTAAALRGRLPIMNPGIYRLRVRPQQADDSLPAEELAFQVVDASREMAQPMADPIYLRQLAELTIDHGGASFAADQIDALIETIAQRRKLAETPIVEKFRLGDGPKTGWILFTLFAAAMSLEWFLRRHWGLA